MIRYFEQFPDLRDVAGVSTINDTIAIFKYSNSETFGKISTELRYPHKFNFFVVIHKIAGTLRMKIDMVDYFLDRDEQYMIRISPGQIVSVEERSDDIELNVMLMSQTFIESLIVYMGQDISIKGMMSDPIRCFTNNERFTMDYILKAIREIIDDDANPYRHKVLEHIIMAVFYGSQQTRMAMMEDVKPRTNGELLTVKFLQEVKQHFREERQLGFYAERLCITPRYLSRVVKDTTGSSAAEWIERYVVLEARALLKSTNMTIQQVSDMLNFPSQTFFGKYFKRRMGISPKEYRRIG